MPIIFKNGDMFAEPTEAIVNTVNCVGVMGKGVALEFKNRWPENFKQYKKLCGEGNLNPGQMFVFENTDMFNSEEPKFLINFPTKKHWRSKSKLEFIVDGLDDFIVQLHNRKIKSVALPPLGCGNGGLDWADVRLLLVERLSPIADVEFVIFGPKGSDKTPEYAGSQTAMNFERAVLLKTAAEFEKYFGGSLTRIVSQKIVYFLQALGVKYNLTFERNVYGPYSKKLKTAFLAMERQKLIVGFTTEKQINVSAAAYAQADDFLSALGGDEATKIIRRLDLLIDGYESPYGMELLSSVHYLACGENVRPADKVVEAMRDWSERKGNDFSPEVIRAAYDRLEGDGLLR